MHCTPEAVQCYKTGEVQYTGKLYLVPSVVNSVFYLHPFKFKDEFWENNSDIHVKLCKSSSVVNSIFVDYSLYYDDYYNNNSLFPTKANVTSGARNRKNTLGHKSLKSEYMFKFLTNNFKHHEKEIYNFMEEFIFKNPITSLC
jgi:hypothetical protein